METRVIDVDIADLPKFKLQLNRGEKCTIRLKESDRAAVLSFGDSDLKDNAIDSFMLLLSAYFKYVKEHSGSVVCIASHYIDGCSPDENRLIALERARSLYNFLTGKDQEWTKHGLDHTLRFDYGSLFAWLEENCGIQCSVDRCADNDPETKLRWAREQFRRGAGAESDACSTGALAFSEQDWNGLYAAYLDGIARRIDSTVEELQGLQSSISFSDPPILLCGDSKLPHPLGGSEANRVDILLFRSGNVPEIKADPAGSSIYGIRKFQAVDTAIPAAPAAAEATEVAEEGEDGFLYTVKSGDYLVKLAEENGLASWKDIYYHPRNEAYRNSHPDPDKIWVGDELWIPASPPADGSGSDADDNEGYPLIYSYETARRNGKSESERSRRPAVGYAQKKLNIFLQNYDRAQNPGLLIGTSPDPDNDEAHPYDPEGTKFYREKAPAQLKVDNVFGDDTENAVKALQSSKGIDVDGKIGPVTWDWLEFQSRKLSKLSLDTGSDTPDDAPAAAPIAGFFGFPWIAGTPLPLNAIAANVGALGFPGGSSDVDLNPFDAVAHFYLPAKTWMWMIGCSWFVQIAHLYALAATLGQNAFNTRVGDKFLFKSHRSSGMHTVVVYSRSAANEPFNNGTATDPRPPDQVLADAPVGSRVCFHNPQTNVGDWRNENTIKLGPDRYAAHGGVGRTGKNVFSSDEVKSLMCAEGGTSDPKAVFVNYIELYEFPATSKYYKELEDAVAQLKPYRFGYPVKPPYGTYVWGNDDYDATVWLERYSNDPNDPGVLEMRKKFEPNP